MIRASLILGLGLLIAAPAHAVEPARASGIAAQVAEQVAAALPPGLALVDVALPAGASMRGGEVSISWSAPPRAGQLSVQVIVHRSGREVARTWAAVKLSPLRSVLVSRTTLRAGMAIGRGDLEISERPVTAGSGWQIAPDVLVGAPVLRDVPAGQIIGDRDIAAPAPLARGTQLRLVARRGLITVTATGTLEHPARLGESAVARLATDHRVVNGRLIDRTTLLVGEDQ